MCAITDGNINCAHFNTSLSQNCWGGLNCYRSIRCKNINSVISVSSWFCELLQLWEDLKGRKNTSKQLSPSSPDCTKKSWLSFSLFFLLEWVLVVLCLTLWQLIILDIDADYDDFFLLGALGCIQELQYK